MATTVESAPQAAAVEVEPDGLWEFIDGHHVEKPLGVYESWLAGKLSQALGVFADAQHLGRVVPEMAFLIEPEDQSSASARCRVRLARTLAARTEDPPSRVLGRDPRPGRRGRQPIEYLERDDPETLRYFAAGVRLVWFVDPDVAQVYVYESPKSNRILDRGDVLDGGDVLPGFRLALAEFFEDEGESDTPAAEGP